MRILILDDDPSRSETLAASVARACPDAEVRRASGTTVARAVAETAPALAVVGPGLVDGDGGGELVRALCADHPELAVLVVSTRDLAAPAVAALRAGAADYVVLAEGDDLAALGRAAARLLCRDGHRPPRPVGRAAPDALAGLVGRSPAMLQVRELVRTAARAEAHVRGRDRHRQGGGGARRARPRPPRRRSLRASERDSFTPVRYRLEVLL